MKHGSAVGIFEREFAAFVGARYAIAMCNGTATLHTALVASGVQPGESVAVPPLTMASTTIAVLHAGAVPVFCDVHPDMWLMEQYPTAMDAALGVSLYGLPWNGQRFTWRDRKRRGLVDDSAQTLAPFLDERGSYPHFKSYSFQSSKIVSTGEGGMLVTNDEALATTAREFSSLGYRMHSTQPRIDSAALKSATYDRHHRVDAWNYRMNDVTAAEGLKQLDRAEYLLEVRQDAAQCYRDAIQGCTWVTPQYVPQGWRHDYWTYAIACDTTRHASALSDAVVRHGGERPYPAWKLTYQEPAFRHLAKDGTCPIAEALQPRLLQFQTNDAEQAEQNAAALKRAIQEIG